MTFRYRGVLCEVWKHIRVPGLWGGSVIGRKNAPHLTWSTIIRDGKPVFGTELPRTKEQAISDLKSLVDLWIENNYNLEKPGVSYRRGSLS